MAPAPSLLTHHRAGRSVCGLRRYLLYLVKEKFEKFHFYQQTFLALAALVSFVSVKPNLGTVLLLILFVSLQPLAKPIRSFPCALLSSIYRSISLDFAYPNWPDRSRPYTPSPAPYSIENYTAYNSGYTPIR